MKRTIFKRSVVLLSFVAAFIQISANVKSNNAVDGPVKIRKVSTAPFLDGQRVESVWEKADTLCGFVVPGTMDAAIDDADVQFLYDDKNVYVSLKGYFKKGCARRPVDRRLFRDNCFEVFFSDSKTSEDFAQFAFSQEGLIYYGDCVDGAKRELKCPQGLSLKVIERDGCTTFNLTLPIETLCIGKSLDNKKVALFVARRNTNFEDEQREDSAWGAMPLKYDYGQKKYWGSAVFAAADKEAPRRVLGPRNGLKVNLLPNPYFSYPDRSWEILGKGVTQRRETMPMSRKWIIRTTGDSYQFLKGVPQEYERDTEYTLEVRARAHGGEALMNILELYKRETDGKTCEGTSIARQVLLGKDFHTYYFPYRSTHKGKPLYMFFYKWEPKSDEGRGIDIASVRMFKGKVSALDIRKISRTGRKAPVGAGVPISANPYGRSAAKARGLVFTRHFRSNREILEVFEGTGIDVDILSMTGPDQDIYMTDNDPDTIKARLAGGKYDFYCVLPAVAAGIGSEMSGKIIDAVKNGAGLYYMYNSNNLHFEKMLKEASLKPLDKENVFVKSYPYGIAKELDYTDPVKSFQIGTFAKGRIIREAVGRQGMFKFIMPPSIYGSTDFPFSRYADPLQLKMLLYVAAKDNTSDSAAVKTFWEAVDSTGIIRHKGVAADVPSALKQAKSSCAASASYAVSFKSVDAKGYTVDWQADYFKVDGPTVSLNDKRSSCIGEESALFVADVKGANGDATVRWTMEDFSGRVLESGSVRAGEKIEIPIKSLFTNKGIVRAYLQVGGKVVAVDRADIYARERDWQRFENDFGVGIWGQGMAVSRDSYPIVDAQLQKAGVFCQCLPINYYSEDRNLVFSMSSGMAVGGGYLSKHEVFYPKQIGESNNRSTYAPINTKKAREMIAVKARETSKRCVKYGPIAYTVCDEPNLSLRFTKDEPDEEPENIAEYRRRMEVKYSTIGEYNRRHLTSHVSFADIGPVRIEDARRTGNFAEYVEWRNFNTDRWIEAIRVVADSGKSVDPSLRLSLFNSFGQTAVSGNDYWKLLTKSGLGFSNEYTSMVYMRRDAIYNFDEFYRSFRPDLRVWGFTGYNMNAAQVKFTPWWFAAHRYGGFTWFAVMDWDWRFIDQPTLALTRDAADIKAALDSSRVQNGLGKLFLTYQWKPRDIAVYYSHDSLLTSTLLGKERISYDIGSTGPLHDYMYSRQGIQYILEDMLCQFDFVAPEQVLSGSLEKYKVVFMPRIIALSDMEIGKLKSFIKAGGKVVADQLPGDYDELGVKRTSNPLAGLGVVVTGANFDDLSISQRKEVLDLVKQSGASPVLASQGIENIFGREAMHFTDGVNSIFPVLRMPMRSSDKETQQFAFPEKGHIYDVKTGKYLGFGDKVTALVPHADASVWAILPEKIGSIAIDAPDKVRCGTDLVADIRLEKAQGKGVFHIEVISPAGECAFHMKRNMVSENGKVRFVFRMAENDMCGKWTIRITDVITSVKSSFNFMLEGK